MILLQASLLFSLHTLCSWTSVPAHLPLFIRQAASCFIPRFSITQPWTFPGNLVPHLILRKKWQSINWTGVAVLIVLFLEIFSLRLFALRSWDSLSWVLVGFRILCCPYQGSLLEYLLYYWHRRFRRGSRVRGQDNFTLSEYRYN